MPFNGSGTFTVVRDFTDDQANNINPQASRFDDNDSDFATGLSNCVTRDGQSPPTANIPFGGFRGTGLGDATARTDVAKVSQVQDGAYIKAVGSGTNTITANLAPTLTAYVAGLSVELIPANTITGTATLNLNGVGAQTIKKSIGGALVALVANDIIVNVPARITFLDATTPVLMNPPTYGHGADVASASTVVLDSTTGDCVDVTGTTTITAITLAEGSERTVRFTGALTLTNGASLVLPGSADILTVAGDYAIFRGYASGVVRCVSYTGTNSRPVGQVGTIASGSINTSGDTTINIPAGAWKEIEILVVGLTAATDFAPYWRVNADTGANYDYYFQTLEIGATSAFTVNGATAASIFKNTVLVDDNATNNALNFSAVISNPAGTTNRKDIRNTTYFARDSAGTNCRADGIFRWNSTSAITSLTLLLRGSTGSNPTGTTINASGGTYLVRGYL